MFGLNRRSLFPNRSKVWISYLSLEEFYESRDTLCIYNKDCFYHFVAIKKIQNNIEKYCKIVYIINNHQSTSIDVSDIFIGVRPSLSSSLAKNQQIIRKCSTNKKCFLLDQFTSKYVQLCSFMSKSVQLCSFMSNYVQLCPFMFIYVQILN